MKRSIIVNDGADHLARVWAGVEWLVGKGGGTVFIPLWQDFETYFGERREPCERRLALSGVRVEKLQRYSVVRGHVLVLYPDAQDMEIIERQGRDGDTMAVEWNTRWLDPWRERFDVDEYAVDSRDGT